MSGAVCCLKVEWKFGVDLSSKVEFLLGEKKSIAFFNTGQNTRRWGRRELYGGN